MTDIPSSWRRVCGIHIGQGAFSALWAAHDRATDVVTFYDEYSVALGHLAVHAAAINQRGTWAESGIDRRGSWIPVLIDITSQGSKERDGQLAMAQELSRYNVNMTDVPVDQNVGAKDIEARASTGRLRVWSALQELPRQYANYRRDEDGLLPEEGYGLMRCAGLCLGPGLMVAISEQRMAQDEDQGQRPDTASGRNPTTGY